MNFSDLDFTLNGDATWSTDCRLELTSENPMKSGSAFAAITFDDTEKYPFEAYYEYDISDTIINGTSVGGSADGIAFLVHIDPQGVNALNDAGGAIGVYGAGGIHCAIVIELDTYFGPTNVGPHAPFSTENYVRALDIIATDEAGKATRYAEVDITDIFSMQGKVWISHNNGVLDVYLATQTAISRPLNPIVSVNMPIPALLLSRDEVYIGFSSSTGGEYDRHEVVFCSFEEAYTPEPTLTPTNKPVALPSAPLPSPSDKPTLSPTVDFPKRPKPPVTVPIKPTLQPSTVPVVPPTSINIVPPKAVERCDEDDDESKSGKGKGGSKAGKGKGGTNHSSSSRTVGKGGSFSDSGKGGSKGSDCDTNSESKGNDDSKGNSKGKAGGKSGKRGRGKASKAQARTESTKAPAKKGKRQLANTDSPTKKKKKTSHKKKKVAHNQNKKKKANHKRKKATTTRTATSKSGKRQLMADDLIYYK